MNLKFFSHTTFYDIQKKYLIPVVNEAWAEHKRGILNATQEEEPVNVISDGRSDSPGHSAKYGTYTMMSDAGKVLTFNIVQVTEVTSSNAMEKEGFERCFNELRNEGVGIGQRRQSWRPHVVCSRNRDFLNDPNLIGNLKLELPRYLAKADGIAEEVDAVQWWKTNEAEIPHWSSAAKMVLLLQPSSVASERVFSFLTSFGHRQDMAFQDYIECKRRSAGLPVS